MFFSSRHSFALLRHLSCVGASEGNGGVIVSMLSFVVVVFVKLLWLLKNVKNQRKANI